MEGIGQAPGGEQAPARHSKVQRKRRSREALTQRPGDTTVAWRGSARVVTTASSQRKTPTTRRCNNKLTKPKHHRGRGLTTRGQAQFHHGQSPARRRRRGCRRQGRNRVDLADKRNRRRLIYRLGGISAAGTNRARRNQARRRSRQVSRERGEERVSEEGKEVTGRSRPSHWSSSTSWLGADRWAWPTSGPGMAVREREVEGVF
jgi:hypothetical protein